MEDMTFEEHVVFVEKRLEREPRYRLALYRLLDFCQQERTLEEIEEEVTGYPEMASAAYKPRTLLTWLVEPEAIICLNPDPEEDEEGTEETPEEDSEREPYRFQDSVVGAQVWENYVNSKPLDTLMGQYPQYVDAFKRTMEFCAQLKTLQEVNALFKDDPILETPKKVYPNFFLDKLEGAGGLYYRDGWTTSDEGKAFLADN